MVRKTKLPPKKVIAIREAKAAGEATTAEIAAKYNISSSMVYRIVTGVDWGAHPSKLLHPPSCTIRASRSGFALPADTYEKSCTAGQRCKWLVRNGLRSGGPRGSGDPDTAAPPLLCWWD